MPIPFYQYAQCILDEMCAGCNWQENKVSETIYRIHSYAHDMLVEIEPSGIIDYFSAGKMKCTVFKPLLGSYPSSFARDACIKEFPYFTVKFDGLIDYSYNWFVALALDIYHFTWHLLHMKIKTGQFNIHLCMKLQEFSNLLKEGLKSLCNSDFELKSAKRQITSVKDDYVAMIASILNQSDENFLSFKEFLPQLAETYPQNSMFIGKIIKVYFCRGECFVQKGKAKDFKPINSNTLQNYYSKAKQTFVAR